jgi:hypothetical protein
LRGDRGIADALPMRSLVLASFVVLVASVFAGCGTLQSGTAAPLLPSTLSAQFKYLDKANPFAKPATKVDVTKVGIGNYDAFFKQSAQVKGTVILADIVLKETDAFIAKVKKEGGKNALSPEQLQEFEAKRTRLGVVTGLLADVPEKSGALAKQAQALTGGAAKTFVGPNAVKLPGVMKGLDQASNDMKTAAARAPKLAEHAASTTASLVGL